MNFSTNIDICTVDPVWPSQQDFATRHPQPTSTLTLAAEASICHTIVQPIIEVSYTPPLITEPSPAPEN